MNGVDERIRQALQAQANTLQNGDLRAEAAPRARDARRPRQVWLAPLLAAAAVVVVAVGTTVVVTVSRADRATPARPLPSPTVPTTPSPPTTSAVPVVPPPSAVLSTPPPSFALGYQPLWPFASFGDAEAWRLASASGGHQPWHLDAGQTALSFTQGYLGFSELTTVTSTHIGSDGAHVGVGYRDPNGVARTSAVLHLVRFGSAADAPWEVVGSDDTTFSLELPAYGSLVTSPMTVGGHITGVDENIRISVRTLSASSPVGQSCCLPAGGDNQPWHTSVAFSATGAQVLTVAASTGGHLQAVERFAIQGVRS